MTGNAIGAWLAASFAAWLVAHAVLVVGLARRTPRWRAAVALVVPPLAPAWGWGTMPMRASLWAIALIAYALGVVIAR